MTDVIVVGAGLGGLSAARDLDRAGVDVVVLEARERPGGRVEQTTLPDGRVAQLGGELVGGIHTSYLGLVDELGLTLRPSYIADPGEMTSDLVDGVHVGDELPWLTDEERADGERLAGLARAVAQTVDPDDPWSHPDAARRRSAPARARRGGAVRNHRPPGARMPLAVQRAQARRREALDGDVAQRPDRDGTDDGFRGKPLAGVEPHVDPLSHVDTAHGGAEPQTLAQLGRHPEGDGGAALGDVIDSHTSSSTGGSIRSPRGT